MELVIRTRLGVGVDIESNEDICYRIGYLNEKGEEEEDIVCYNGLLIKLPFLTIYLGEFFPIEFATKA